MIRHRHLLNELKAWEPERFIRGGAYSSIYFKAFQV